MTKFTSPHFLANLRELKSRKISDMGVYRSVVEKVVFLDEPLTTKTNILLKAVPDLGIIISLLSLCKSKGQITNEHYTNLVRNCLLKINTEREYIRFDPTYMRRMSNGG